MRPRKKVTLQDVAAELNISVVTASNALSGKAGVSGALREKVKSTAAALGYVYTPKKPVKVHAGSRIAILTAGQVFAELADRMNGNAAGEMELASEMRASDEGAPASGRADPEKGAPVSQERAVPVSGGKVPGQLSRTDVSKSATLLSDALYQAVRKAALAQGYTVMDGGQKVRQDSSCGGLIVCGNPFAASTDTGQQHHNKDAWLEKLHTMYSCPMVGVGFANIRVDMDYVVSDAYHAGFERMRALLLQGSRHPAVLARSRELTAFEQNLLQDHDRIYGCEEALFYIAKRPLEEEVVRIADIPSLARLVMGTSASATSTQAGSAANAFMDTDPNTLRGTAPDALLCLNREDIPAVTAIKEVSSMQGNGSNMIVTDCGRPDLPSMARMAVSVLTRRMTEHDAPEGVHFVREIL